MNIGRKTKYGTVPAVTIAIAIVVMLTIGPILSSKAADATVQLSSQGAADEVSIGFSQAHIATTSQSSVKMTLTTLADSDPLDLTRVRVVNADAFSTILAGFNIHIRPSNPISAVTDGTPLTPLLLNDITSLSVKVAAESETAGGGGVTPVFEINLKESDGTLVQIAVLECPFLGGVGICSDTDMYIDGISASGRATDATHATGLFATMKPATVGDTSLANSRWEMFDLEGTNTDDGEVHTLAEWKLGSVNNAAIGTLEVLSIGVMFFIGNPPTPAPTASSIVWIDDVEINGVVFHPLSAASFGGESTALFTPRTTPSATSSATD